MALRSFHPTLSQPSALPAPASEEFQLATQKLRSQYNSIPPPWSSWRPQADPTFLSAFLFFFYLVIPTEAVSGPTRDPLLFSFGGRAGVAQGDRAARINKHVATLWYITPKFSEATDSTRGAALFLRSCRKGAGLDLTHTPLQANALAFTLLVDSINRNCFVAGSQNHAHHFAA
jgi:hypothetical protein